MLVACNAVHDLKSVYDWAGLECHQRQHQRHQPLVAAAPGASKGTSCSQVGAQPE
jgi:hypothetical protein